MQTRPVAVSLFDVVRDTGRSDSFRLLHLPAELREDVYLFAMMPLPPIDTASIPGTPARIVIPSIAQTSKQVRDEALAILLRHRPVEISLHSSENLRRALLWSSSWGAHARLFCTIIFSGCLAHLGNTFFRIELQSSEQKPYFKVRGGQFNRKMTDKMKLHVLAYLNKVVEKSDASRVGKLSSAQLTELIQLVKLLAELDPKSEAFQCRSVSVSVIAD